MASTITEKVLARAAGVEHVTPGDNLWVNVDVLMTHDVCGPGTIGVFQREFGRHARVWSRDKVVILPDHYIFTADEKSRRNVDSLREFARAVGAEDAVLFAGRVSQQDLVTFYRRADVYVSMSEHEGFGKPLIESMHLGLPILAYAAGAVPDTLGGAGVLFHHKNYECLAEVVDILVNSEVLRQRVISQQRLRARAFAESEVRTRWKAFLRREGLIAQ